MTNPFSKKIGGISTAAKIMNQLRSDVGDHVLDNLTQLDPDLSQAVQDQMISFDQVAKADDRSLQVLIQEIDQNLLMIALKGAPKSIREQFLKNMSTRSRGVFVDEMNMIGPTRRSQIEEARKLIVRDARKLADVGKFVLQNGDFI